MGQKIFLYKGYPCIRLNGKREFVHILVARHKYKLEKIPLGFQVHHIDGVKTNFKKTNLCILHRKDHWRTYTNNSKHKLVIIPANET